MSWFLKIIVSDRTQHLSNKYSLPIEEVQDLLQYDPTKGRYLEWIVKNHKSQQLRFPEDGPKTIETLTTFTKLQPILKRNNVPIDINKYSYSDLVILIEQYGKQKSKREQHRINEVEGVKELLDFPPYKAVQILTPEASAKLCRGTEWCVKDPRWFEDYLDNLIMVLKDGKPYYLVHEESGQYKDIYDEALLKNNKENDEASDVLKTLYSSGIVKDPVGNDFGVGILDSLTEQEIIKCPQLSYYYAYYILEDRFELGEPVIATNAYYSYIYALNILQDSFELGEVTISKDAQWSCRYASHVLKDRFELGEASIIKSAFWSCDYAKSVIKGRFPEAEPTIAKNAEWAYHYAKFVIKGRFPEAETTIAKNAELSYYYATNVLYSRFELGEAAISTSYLKDDYSRFLNNIK